MADFDSSTFWYTEDFVTESSAKRAWRLVDVLNDDGECVSESLDVSDPNSCLIQFELGSINVNAFLYNLRNEGSQIIGAFKLQLIRRRQ